MNSGVPENNTSYTYNMKRPILFYSLKEMTDDDG
jgi:hypothetical protein